MKVTVRYHAQVRHAAGRTWEAVDLPAGTSVKGLLLWLAEKNGRLGAALLDEGGGIEPSLLMFVGDRQTRGEEILQEGDEVLLLTPIAGGAPCRDESR